jgi:short-subunit dehydrogenase
MTKLKDKTVLITGGAAGIGLIMCKLLLNKEIKQLIIWDIDKGFLQAYKAIFGLNSNRVSCSEIDVSNTQSIQKEANNLLNAGICPDIIINNAGVIVGKQFVDHEPDEINFTMNVNIIGSMQVTRAFLPTMIERGGGHIINVSSAAGLVSNPKMSVYVASKWAMNGWSDSLRIELETLNRGMHVTTVNPYYISTGMFDGVESTPLLPILKPEVVASKIVKAIECNKVRLRLPFLVRFTPLAAGLLPPRWFDLIIGKWFGIYRSMNHFVGHTKEK